jgi:hypothetical protein
MARYSRNEIRELCNRLEARANSALNSQPSQAADLNAAAMLLRLFIQIAEVEVVETSIGSSSINHRAN